MYKKLIVTAIAITVTTATTGATTASASPVLTENGAKVLVGSPITGSSTGLALFTAGIFTLSCPNVHLTGTVTANGGTQVKMEVPRGSVAFSGTGNGGTTCTTGGGNVSWAFASKLCMETVTGTDNIKITGCVGNILFTIGGCEYSATSMNATFSTNADASLNLSEPTLVRTKEGLLVGAVGCPLTAKLDLFMDLTTTNETTLSIS
jgi:hypothetical protein